jgi:hypothetical protein
MPQRASRAQQLRRAISRHVTTTNLESSEFSRHICAEDHEGECSTWGDVMRSGLPSSALVFAAAAVFLFLPQPVVAQPAAVGRTSPGAGPVRVAWGGRHPEAEEVAAILRRLRQRLVKEGRDAREQVRARV